MATESTSRNGFLTIAGWTLLVISVPPFGFGLFLLGLTGYLELTSQSGLSAEDRPFLIGGAVVAVLIGVGSFLLGKHLLRLVSAQKQESEILGDPGSMSSPARREPDDDKEQKEPLGAAIQGLGNFAIVIGVLASMFTSMDGATLGFVMIGGVILSGVGWIMKKESKKTGA